MVYITGDCHADFTRFRKESFPEQEEMTRSDLVLVCGDFGLWHDDAGERTRLGFLSDLPFTIAFVDGNHENFDRLYSSEFRTVPFGGAPAQRIRDNVFHLLRGQIYTFDGKTFFTFGGASSHDISDGILDESDFKTTEEFEQTVWNWYRWGKSFRINHVSWWRQELPTQEEMESGRRNLAAHQNRVDYIVTHCAPQSVASFHGFSSPDRLTAYFDELASAVSFDRWFFGHYHAENRTFSKFDMLYESVVRLL